MAFAQADLKQAAKMNVPRYVLTIKRLETQSLPVDPRGKAAVRLMGQYCSAYDMITRAPLITFDKSGQERILTLSLFILQWDLLSCDYRCISN